MKPNRHILFTFLMLLASMHVVLPAHATVFFDAEIHTVERGLINAIWKQGGESVTARGYTVVWGYFYASPDDVSWGNENNPDVFIKVWFDASGRIDVNFFHVSVPDIDVFAQLDDDPILSGKTTLGERYVRHYFTPSGEQGTITERTPELVANNNFVNTGGTPIPAATGAIRVDDVGTFDAEVYIGEPGFTDSRDMVIWGYFYANPRDVSWGNENNPEVFSRYG